MQTRYILLLFLKVFHKQKNSPFPQTQRKNFLFAERVSIFLVRMDSIVRTHLTIEFEQLAIHASSRS